MAFVLTDSDVVVADEETQGPSTPDIRCPLCGWKPRTEDQWGCTCGHVWNTFDTGGVCPAYLYQWTSTQCLRCHSLVAAFRLVRQFIDLTPATSSTNLPSPNMA